MSIGPYRQLFSRPPSRGVVSESPRTRVERAAFNVFPAYRFGGGRLTYIREDWREVHVEVPLNWRTRNYVGTTFGGSMYAAVDPVYMLMLIRNLGGAYTVWDRAATISFERPGRGTLHAEFHLSKSELDDLRTSLSSGESTTREYEVELLGEDGEPCAVVEKILYVRQDRPEGALGWLRDRLG
jgi:acyl-coenzyme A thioesterase PaaI-like protein